MNILHFTPHPLEEPIEDPTEDIINRNHHTSAVDFNARMEDSNTQCGGVFIYPVLEEGGTDLKTLTEQKS